MESFHEVDLQWHTGEERMHDLLHVPPQDNPTSPYLTSFAANLLLRSPLLALGTLDSTGRPWTTVWGGESGFARVIGQSVIGVRATADRTYDPVIETLLGNKADGQVVRNGRMVSGLGIDLENRKRIKLYGRMIAGILSATKEGIGEVQLAVKIEQSLGNCPKYLNKKHIIPDIPQPRLMSESVPLVQAAIDLLAKADMFFISSSNQDLDMDTNHRGGPPGFVRLLSNDESGCTMVYPEYSGNRLYQTLGNLLTKPEAGLAFPDYDTGNVLYITGTTEILVREEASRVLPRSNMVVIVSVKAARLVERGLSFRGVRGEYSPYNPPVRFHVKEQPNVVPDAARPIYANLVDKQILTPAIARFRFHIVDPERSTRWKPGQYVALGFDKELDIGYSHMRDDDPQSLNDDYVRTFTVSSRPDDASDFSHFEITIRRVGAVTEHLFRHNPRMELEIPLKGFGGEFMFHQDENEHIGVIAGGIGITPMLAQVQTLDLARVQIYWSVRADDLGLVLDSFECAPSLAASTKLFITGKNDTAAARDALPKLAASKAVVRTRRMALGDLELGDASGGGGTAKARVETWYVCTGPEMRRQLLQWLEGRTVVFEDFNY